MLKRIICILFLTLCWWFNGQPVQAQTVNFEKGASFKQVYRDKFTEWYVNTNKFEKGANNIITVYSKLHEKQPVARGEADTYRIENYDLNNNTSRIVEEYNYDSNMRLLTKHITKDASFEAIVPNSYEANVMSELRLANQSKGTQGKNNVLPAQVLTVIPESDLYIGNMCLGMSLDTVASYHNGQPKAENAVRFRDGERFLSCRYLDYDQKVTAVAFLDNAHKVLQLASLYTESQSYPMPRGFAAGQPFSNVKAVYGDGIVQINPNDVYTRQDGCDAVNVVGCKRHIYKTANPNITLEIVEDRDGVIYSIVLFDNTVGFFQKHV